MDLGLNTGFLSLITVFKGDLLLPGQAYLLGITAGIGIDDGANGVRMKSVFRAPIYRSDGRLSLSRFPQVSRMEDADPPIEACLEVLCFPKTITEWGYQRLGASRLDQAARDFKTISRSRWRGVRTR